LFTIVNLGITAESSRIWYASKFGAESIAQRWRMVPFVY
jgi:3-oxo-5-alpha-steroid 4-dehydrogenase 3